MAGRDPRDRDTDIDEEDLHALILQHSKPIYLHLLVNLLLSVLLVGSFIGGVLTIRGYLRQADVLLATKPENRAQLLAKEIDRAHKKTEQDYGSLTARMDDPSVGAVSQQFSVMHQLTVEGEQDYARLLNIYRQVSYQLASRIRGSGEWYFYYEKEIEKAIQRHRQLESQLNHYLSDKK